MDIKLKNTKAYLKGFVDNQLIQYFLEAYNTDRPRGGNKYGGVTSRVESSGMGGQSLRSSVEGDTINLYGDAHLKYVDEGTQPFKPNVTSIKNWIRQKPVSLDDVKGSSLESKVNTLAFLISRSISFKGIAPANYILEVIERSVPEIVDAIGEPLVDDIGDNLKEIMIALGYHKKGNRYTLERE